MADAPAIPTCRVCGCTDGHACAGGCAWFAPGLCTVCALAVEAVFEWMGRGVKPDLRALTREVEARAIEELNDDEPLVILIPDL